MAISNLGAGAWGTAIAISLGSKKDVILWTRNETTFESINGKDVDNTWSRLIKSESGIKARVDGLFSCSHPAENDFSATNQYDIEETLADPKQSIRLSFATPRLQSHSYNSSRQNN